MIMTLCHVLVVLTAAIAVDVVMIKYIYTTADNFTKQLIKIINRR